MSNSIIPFPRQKKAPVSCVTKVPVYARKLASSLMLTVQIQEGHELVNIIGRGNEVSNQRAIESWLMKHYSEEEIQFMESPVNNLGNALVRHINDSL